MPDFAERDPNNLMLAVGDGTFIEAGDRAGVASMAIARGAQVVDLNLDGKLDLVVQNRWTGPEVWRQTGEAGTSVEVRLQQDGANRDAIGAVLEIKRGAAVERHEISSGGGHASGSFGWVHLGLGTADKADLRVIWPDGAASDWMTIPSGSFMILRPGAAPEAWAPE